MIKIVPASENYIEQILEIENEAISPPWTHGALLSAIYDDDSYFVLAKDELVEVLGFAILRQVGDDGELLQIAVCKSARCRGVGDALIDAVLQHATESKYKSVFLEVRKSNNPAIGLYEKHGFSTLRIRKDYYTNPIEDANIMVKTLL